VEQPDGQRTVVFVNVAGQTASCESIVGRRRPRGSARMQLSITRPTSPSTRAVYASVQEGVTSRSLVARASKVADRAKRFVRTSPLI
jgi:hypothetical protein